MVNGQSPDRGEFAPSYKKGNNSMTTSDKLQVFQLIVSGIALFLQIKKK